MAAAEENMVQDLVMAAKAGGATVAVATNAGASTTVITVTVPGVVLPKSVLQYSGIVVTVNA